MRSRVAAELVALFAPPACAGCRAPLDDPREALCPACRRELPWLWGVLCPCCALPAPCAPCPASRAAFDRAWAPMAHAGPARAVVAALKFDGALALADLMAAQLAAAAPPHMLERGAQIVPVPTHPARARRRGFDHAERLATALSRRTGLPLNACLSRTGHGERQLGKTRRGRLQPGQIEFAAAARGQAPRRALLVDDVHTTGATLDAAARALKDAGVRSVSAMTYARTPRP